MTTPTFPLPPNWVSPFRVTRDFRTTVQRSRSGKEQRRALRVTPRKTIQFDVMASGQTATNFSRFLRSAIGYTVTVADESQAIRMTASLSIGGNGTLLSWMPSTFAVGATVLLRQGEQTEVQVIQSVSGYTITFTGPTAFNWSIGAQVLPLLSGRIDPAGMKTTLESDAVISGTVNFSVTPTSEVTYAPPTAPTSFNGRELFLLRPNWATKPDVTSSRDFSIVDYSEGAINYFNHIAFMTRAEEATYLGIGRAAVSAIENLFFRMKGQQGEFYKPTWLNDIQPIEVSPVGANTLRQNGTDFANYFAGDTVFQAIYIQYIDGSYSCYTVAGITAIAGYSVIQLDTNLSRSIDPATVQFISWLPVHRFATDTLVTDWVTDSIAQVKLSLMTLEDLPAEAQYEFSGTGSQPYPGGAGGPLPIYLWPQLW